MKGIADTGFLVAFANRHDRHHGWALGVARTVAEPLLTCEAVVAEAAFHLRNVPLVLAMVAEGLVEIAFDCRSQFPALAVLAGKYADQQPDLADLCLVRMSELYPQHRVITVDATDFRKFRRNQRQVIALVCPPGA